MRAGSAGIGALVCVLAALASPAFAQSDVSIRSVTTAGNGCPRGSVQVLMNANQASVLFSSYTLNNNSATALSARNCNLGIRLAVPDGVTLSVATVEWQGIVSLEQGSLGQFVRAFLFGGLPQINVTRPFNQAGVTPFVFRDRLSGAAVSGCRSREVSILAGTLLALRGTGAASVDTVDIDGPAMRISFQRGRCQPASRPAQPPA